MIKFFESVLMFSFLNVSRFQNWFTIETTFLAGCKENELNYLVSGCTIRMLSDCRSYSDSDGEHCKRSLINRWNHLRLCKQ